MNDQLVDKIKSMSPKQWYDYLMALLTTYLDPVHAAGGCYCKECKYYAPAGGGVGDCNRESVQYLNVGDDDFCSFGERR